MGAFLIKSPVFIVHGWLPKAHVEAPVAGSIMLAGVLLKYGGYGCMMVYYYFVSFQPLFGVVVMRVRVWGGLLCGIMCLRQVDMKAVIAYSSIGHMGLCIGGFVSCYSLG